MRAVDCQTRGSVQQLRCCGVGMQQKERDAFQAVDADVGDDGRSLAAQSSVIVSRASSVTTEAPRVSRHNTQRWNPERQAD